LNIPLLGTLQAGAPADLIAVRGDVMQNFKPLEYPDLVISGGKIAVNYFNK
jgi:imidazolonepropionase-like amidohydrolase